MPSISVILVYAVVFTVLGLFFVHPRLEKIREGTIHFAKRFAQYSFFSLMVGIGGFLLYYQVPKSIDQVRLATNGVETVGTVVSSEYFNERRGSRKRRRWVSGYKVTFEVEDPLLGTVTKTLESQDDLPIGSRYNLYQVPNTDIIEAAKDFDFWRTILFPLFCVGMTLFGLVSIYGLTMNSRASNEGVRGTSKLGKHFGNTDKKAALCELDKALRGDHSLAFLMIAPHIRKLLKQKKGALAKCMPARGHGHDLTICWLAKVILDSELPSGQHHIYRGVLSQPGHHLLALYKHAVDRLWSAEPEQDVPKDAEINAMMEAIKRVG